MAAEHDEAVGEARAHLAAKPDPARPLGPLSESFAASREALHVVAEELLKPKRELETGGRIALRFTPGGFGTPPWERGEASGSAGQARVEALDLVLVEDGAERRCSVADLEACAELLGVDPPTAGGNRIDAAAAASLADWFAFGTVVIAELHERHPDLDPDPINLWPEHFDVATVIGSEAAGSRANCGASPGDEDHPEPYLYVGPWDQETKGELWNATAFVGGELRHDELLEARDQLEAGLRFCEERILSLGC